MLAIMIKNCETLKKLNVFGTELGISQFADDTTLLLKDDHQIPDAIQNIEEPLDYSLTSKHVNYYLFMKMLKM